MSELKCEAVLAPTNLQLNVTIRVPKVEVPGLAADTAWVFAEDASGSGTAVALCGPDEPQSRADALHLTHLWNIDNKLRNSGLSLSGKIKCMVLMMVHRHLEMHGPLKFFLYEDDNDMAGFIRADGQCRLFGFGTAPVVATSVNDLGARYLVLAEPIVQNDPLVAEYGRYDSCDMPVPLAAWLMGA